MVTGYDEALTKFFEDVSPAFLNYVDFKVVHCALIASPGRVSRGISFTVTYCWKPRGGNANLLSRISHIILVHTTLVYKHSLRGVLDASSVMDIIVVEI